MSTPPLNTSDGAPKATRVPLFHGRPGPVADVWDPLCDGHECVEGVLDLLIAENASLCADLRNGLGATKAGIDEDCIEADAVVAFLDLQEQLTAFRQAFIDLSSGMTDVLGLIHSPRDMPPEIAQRVARFLATVRGELPDLTAGSKALGEVWHEFCQLTDPSMKDAAAAFGRYHALVAAAGPDGAARS